MRKLATRPMWVLLFLLATVPLRTISQTPFPLDTVRTRAARQGLWFPAENRSIPQILSLLNTNGSFSDRGSDLYVLEKRIRKMAQAWYADPTYAGSNSLKNDIYRAWKHWFDNAQPGSAAWGDWTRTDLAMPRWLGLTACMMYEALDADRATNADAAAIHNYIRNYYNQYVWGSTNGRTEAILGANLSSRLVGSMSLAAYLEDQGKANRASDSANAVLLKGAGTQSQAPNYPHTGLTTDYGFHQHNSQGGQMLWGNYGLVFLSDLTFYVELVGGTNWDLSAAQYQELYTTVKEGLDFFMYKGTVSLAVAGRIALNPNKYGEARRFGAVLREMARRCRISPNGFSLAQYNEFLDMRLRANDPNLPAILDRSKYYFTSDMLVHARPDHHVTVRMSSNRTGAKELGIGYSTMNYHMADGATYFLIDGDEYLDARLGMDYTAIPGITCEQKTGQPTRAGANTMNSANTYAGGLSDGRNTLSGFKYDRSHPYASTTANKAYFLFEDAFAFMGSDIEQVGTASGETWTTLNQVERRGVVTYNVGNGQNTIGTGTNTQRNFNNINQVAWFHHDGIGYIILPNGGVDIKLWAENRRRRWKDIDQSNSDNNLRNINMFQLSINHGTNPNQESYEYLVVPNVSVSQTANLANNLPLQIMMHSQQAQVVYNPSDQILQAAIYQASQQFPTPWGFDVEADKPVMIMMKKDSSVINLKISDPMQQENRITLELEGEFFGPFVSYNPANNISRIRFDMPRGIYRGQAVDMTIGINNVGPLPVELIEFTGEYQPALGSNHLEWYTSKEENSQYFEVMRSVDGQHFEAVGQLPASGNSAEMQKYTFADQNPLEGRNYYQLRMVDLDGSFSLSDILELTAKAKTTEPFKIYPNPVSRGEFLRVEIQLENALSPDIQVMDLNGRIMEKIQNINLDQNGKGWFELDTSAWPGGIYLVNLSAYGVYSKKVVVK